MSEALRLPGVVDVITAKDIPGKKVRTMFGYHEELLAEAEVACEFVVFHSVSLVMRFFGNIQGVLQTVTDILYMLLIQKNMYM